MNDAKYARSPLTLALALFKYLKAIKDNLSVVRFCVVHDPLMVTLSSPAS